MWRPFPLFGIPASVCAKLVLFLLMDLLAQSRCSFCDKVFCCPQHRRSHQLLSHPGKYKKKMLRLPIERKQTESYALEMRKILYSDQNRSNFHKSRKRKYLAVSKIVHEQSSIELSMVNRKILVPRRKKSENTEVENTDGTEDNEEMGDEIISPIEEKKSKDVHNIFTTSTPLPKRGTNFLSSFSPQISCQLSAPLGSITDGIPAILLAQKDTIQITSISQKRVTFSESVESLYNTASETASPQNKPGILASVANAFQSAIQRIPGMGQVNEDSYAIPCSPGGSKRKRASRDSMGRFVITGRRPLRKTNWTSPP